MLTAIPLGAKPPQDGERSGAAAYFPLVGLLVGAVPYALTVVAEAAGWHGGHTLLAAAGVMVVWGLLTRFLHWDGLADVADAWFAPSLERRLTVLDDPRVGAFGATAIMLVGIAEFAALATLLQYHELFLVIIPIFSRLSATFAAWFGTPARPGGLGASVMGRPSALGALATALVVGGAAVLAVAGYGVPGAAIAALGIVLALAIPHAIALRFGGVTGDVMGASIVLTEVALCTAAAAVFV